MSIVFIRFPAAAAGDLQRAPQLEALLAHAAVPTSVEDWRREAFRVIAGPDESMPAVATAWAPAVSEAPQTATAGGQAAWTCVATPLHCVAGMSGVTLSEGGLLNLDEAEAQSLASNFNQVFSGSGMKLAARGAAVLLCMFDRTIEVSTSDPERAVGHDLFEFQPAGADAPRLRAAMSEFEMWLYDHDVNRARAARGLPSVTGLWLWGGGPALPAPPVVRGWTAGRDPLFAAFGELTAFPAAARAGESLRSGVVACAANPGSDAWADVERRWLAPAAAALAAGDIDALLLSAGKRRFHVDRRGRWRFWRRARPWWESLQAEGRG